MSEASSGGLGAVYQAGSAGELRDAYAAWSGDYDRETGADGYCLPFLIAAWVARHVKAGDGPLLDAGCGTGLTGPALRALGYRDIEGLDFSPAMLALARQRGAYTTLVEAELGKPLPYAAGRFSAVFATGVFTAGHAPASSLDELVRIVRQGGKAIFTVRDTVLDRGGFRPAMKRLAAEGHWRPVEQSPPFRAFAVAEPDVLVQTFVFEVV